MYLVQEHFLYNPVWGFTLAICDMTSGGGWCCKSSCIIHLARGTERLSLLHSECLESTKHTLVSYMDNATNTTHCTTGN